MWPCLLLTLALLGTVPASHPGECLSPCPTECPPHPCPLPGTPWGHPQSLPPQCHAHTAHATHLGLAVGGRGTPGTNPPLLCPAAPRQPQGVPAGETAPLHYTVVKKLRTYSGAQRYCQDVYRGQLASVHSAARNQELQKLAQTYNILLAPWIGAVTSRRAGRWESYWEDSSPWNYANWAPTHPFHIVTTCTTLSIRDGLWRSRFCLQLRPFICQY
ncbi:proteoglycan 3-like isoform X2 [Onychostruthus taczanowskii]|uniref:proteoglycan 3-like isoform X2 n=1 Tax=Onychostruthus taczanowskii TaxID=356909 RepID=UPI001B80E5A7|nr:proteoglycan 3-like isoform X2 [Onychostruthus taczanowskii]